ncbi:LOW QUALITY PROTEIN: hypothetical protein NLU13_6818 [Sarocladium strictum]|uniref:Uncharacterized protein n=1 Tax=Sarocladium strictum TaxID=5046 RepID=A0AA39GEE2_SARSR|nr:LOW QUALITY PROTEIN: hypothetical protein NLU13_6818 [Sarocladium strictum]
MSSAIAHYSQLSDDQFAALWQLAKRHDLASPSFGIANPESFREFLYGVFACWDSSKTPNRLPTTLEGDESWARKDVVFCVGDHVPVHSQPGDAERVVPLYCRGTIAADDETFSYVFCDVDGQQLTADLDWPTFDVDFETDGARRDAAWYYYCREQIELCEDFNYRRAVAIAQRIIVDRPVPLDMFIMPGPMPPTAWTPRQK